jgi:hypothetical protein
MSPELIKLLAQEHPGKEHDELLQKCKDLVKLSRDRMTTYYPKWDKYDRAYRAEKEADLEDKKAADKKEPVKMALPLTMSQINTFVAFCYQVYTQRATFFELSGTGAEDIAAAKMAENVLEYNLDYNKFKGDKLQQFLLDIGRFGLGIFKHSWHVDTVKCEKQVPMALPPIPGMPMMQGPMTTQLVDEVKYQGNKIVVTSPYRFFPDPRLPLTRFQEGEFCASEDEYSEFSLKKMEARGMIAGLEFVKQLTADNIVETDRRVSFADSLKDSGVMSTNTKRFYICTEVQLEMIPAETKFNGKPIGESKEPEKFLVWILNDSRIVRFEPMGYLHSEFTYDVTQYNNDQIRFINFGMAEILEQLQDVQNWFINSRITNVRQIIGNKLIVDPKGVEMQDLRDRNPVIRLKPTVQGSGVEKWITQLQLQDVTTNHITDAKLMEDFAKTATGVTENILGQFSSGRRSATENRNVNNSAAARLLLTAYSIWEVALLPLGRHMLTNIRDGMTVEQLVRIVGQSNVMNNQQAVPQFILADKSQLLGNYDFLVFDGTLPSQRGATAQTLQELLINLLQKPELTFVLGIDPRPLFNEIMILRGIRNIDQFRLTPQSAQELISLAGLARNATANVEAQTGSGPAPGGGQQPRPKG